MSTWGRQIIETAGRSIQVTSNGKPEMKAAGVTIDWTTVAAVAGADVTWLDGVVVKIGEKGLRYGQVICRITASGKYGPHDPAAADGRQTITPGACFVLNESMLESEVASDHPPALFGGQVFRDRIIAHASAASLANGPLWTDLIAALPRLQPVLE